MDNIHTGSSFDSFLEDEGIILPSEMESLSKVELEQLEELAKKCPRCNTPTAGKAQRCSKHLKQLRENKKKPGHWQRAQTKADDALRRQKGKNGTAHKKSTGLGSRASIVKQTQTAEKKTGQKLSPDRKQNGKGYAASNTRMVPEKLNRGRHHVDPKKLRAWKARLKKSDIDSELFYTALLAKANETSDTALLDMLHNMSEDGVNQYIDIFDEPLDKSLKHSGILPYDDVAYFDVNDTLLHKTKDKQEDSVKIEGVDDKNNGWHTPNKRNIELMKELKEKGHPIAVWSGAGYKMAKAAVEALKLEPYVDAVMAKPTIYVDNKEAPKFLKNRLWRDPKDSSKDIENFAKSYIENHCQEELTKSTEVSLFQRFEDKYIIPVAMKSELSKLLNKHLKTDYPDKKTQFTDMKSVYFDSAGLDMLKNHTSNADSRFKIRTREYAPNGKLSKADFTYLEVKAKHGNVSDKFRIKMPSSGVEAFKKGFPIVTSLELVKMNPHIAITDLVKRIEDLNKAMSTFNLRPACEINYTRNAFSDGNPNDGLRVTYDENVRSNILDLIPPQGLEYLTKDSSDNLLLSMLNGYSPKDHIILEVKHHGSTPDWLTEFLNAKSLTKASFSKYCHSMAKYATKK